MIKELRLRNFRAFEDARFVLSDDVTVLIGRNGSGKTTIVDAFDFIRASLSEPLYLGLGREGGLERISHRRPAIEVIDDVSLAVVMKIGRQEVLYGFTLGIDGENRAAIKEERLMAAGEGSAFQRIGERLEVIGPNVGIKPVESNLILPLIAGYDAMWKQVLDTLLQIRAYNIKPERVAEAVLVPGRALLRDGSNAAAVLQELQSVIKLSIQMPLGNGHGELNADEVTSSYQIGEDVRWVVDRLGLITPGIEEVFSRPSGVSTRRLSIVFTQRTPSGVNQFAADEMSDGTLRALGILLALRQQPSPSFVLFDEIEDSIHPEGLAVLLSAIQASTDRFQVAITSHSPIVLNYRYAVTAEGTRVAEWSDGTSWLYQLHPNVIKHLQLNDADSIGELFSMDSLRTEDEPAIIGDEEFFALPKREVKRITKGKAGH